MTWRWWGCLLFVWLIILILNLFDFSKRQNASKTPATYLIHLLVSYCHFPHFSVCFLWLASLWAILRLFTTRPCNLFVHGTLRVLTLGNTHLLNAQGYYEIEVSWATSFSCLSAGKCFQLQMAAHLQFLLLSWDADMHFEYMVIYSFQLSLSANIWAPVNCRCWHKR